MIAALVFAGTGTGCAKALQSLVAVNRPGVGAVVTPFEGQSALKISPGNTNATSADVTMRAHVTITDRPLIGSDVSARVSVGHQRTE